MAEADISLKLSAAPAIRSAPRRQIQVRALVHQAVCELPDPDIFNAADLQAATRLALPRLDSKSEALDEALSLRPDRKRKDSRRGEAHRR
jgi:hypothetical protein